jgi:fermentation-respiration switch protein FrsA (DUF1100 family)
LVAVPFTVRIPVLLATIYGSLYLLASRAPYYPEKYPRGFWEMQGRLGASDIWLSTSDGVRIHGWFVERPGASRVTLFLHGNAGNLTYRVGAFESIPAAGSSVLMIDYRGYGRSTGWPTEHGLYRDADAAYDYLLQRGYAAKDIMIHGESLGSAVAVDLASRRPCGGLILEAPFTSAHELAATVLPVIGPLLIWSFNAQRKIGRVHAPVFIVHGDRDELIPQWMGKSMFAAAHAPKYFWSVPGAMHNDIQETAGAAYIVRLREFYDTLRLN